jgi:PAS domain S-box-containing protein
MTAFPEPRPRRAWLARAGPTLVGATVLLLLLALAIQVQQQAHRDAQARALVAHTLRVQGAVAGLEAELLQMESEHRGFLVRGESAFLDRRDAMRAVVLESLAGLRRLVADNPGQSRRLETIAQGIAARVGRMQGTAELVSNQGLDAGRAAFDPDGAASIRPLRERLREFRAAEDALYKQRARLAAESGKRLRWLLPLAPALGIVALAVGLVVLLRDLRARRQAEDERDRFFSLSLDMLCIASSDGYFKRLSPAFTRTLGWSVEELLAKPFLAFVHPDDQAATLAEVERQVGQGLPVLDFENRYRHKDGGWRTLSWKSAPQPDGTMYATARDITERREAERRIMDLNEQLLERQSALEAANKELESFSYSVSHDLRAPLRHIDGYARMLREDVGKAIGEEPRRYLDTIVDSARRMGLLIDDLLAFSRLGRKPLEARSVDMGELARGAMAEVQAQQGNVVQVEIGPLPAAEGDPALLRQVWTNLLSNAVKYSQTRGASARVLVTGEHRGDLLHYSVLDNGVGFDMRYADKLFGVFQRLHSQEEFEGTGVGLAIVQRIVQRHGGAVSAKADPGRGACFSFQLPATEVQG